jgi:hypothetical protein
MLLASVAPKLLAEPIESLVRDAALIDLFTKG